MGMSGSAKGQLPAIFCKAGIQAASQGTACFALRDVEDDRR